MVVDWYRVLIGHEGALRGHIIQREDSPRTTALVVAGFLETLAPDEDVVAAHEGTYQLEDTPAKVVKKSRGKQAKAGPADGAGAQSPSDVVVRDEDDGADGGDGEG